MAQNGAEVNHQHAARQALIGPGAALIAAVYEQVDSTRMEGFDPADSCGTMATICASVNPKLSALRINRTRSGCEALWRQ